MRKISVSLATLVLSFFASTQSHAQAQQDPGLLRKAKFTVSITRHVYKPKDGLPAFEVTPVCTQTGELNVYNNISIIYPEDLARVRCASELKGQKVSVAFGGAIRMDQDTDTGVELKNAALILSWGREMSETPQIVQTASSEPWHTYLTVLSPVSTGKIVDSVPQPPEPSEFFRANIRIQD